MSVDDQADLKSTRKRLSVTGKTPALSVCEDGYVRVGLSSDMRENDMPVLGLYMSLRNEKWKKNLVERVEKEMAGAQTPTARVTRAFKLIGG